VYSQYCCIEKITGSSQLRM
jgi:hypothetical protein